MVGVAVVERIGQHNLWLVQANLLNDFEFGFLCIFKETVGKAQVGSVLNTKNSRRSRSFFIPALYASAGAKLAFSEVDDAAGFALERVMQ